uniref:Uncharacterized protein n=1 Tax=Physcomitrium patens TaxID=3218 RepID=A0A7I4DM15_PHYPA
MKLEGNSCSESCPTISLEPNRARVSVMADSALERDLVVIAQSAVYDQKRALVERHPNDATHAIALSCSPRLALNLLRALGPIFLVGQSGSMCGTIIKQAKEALELFLRFIPFENHCFYVTGFGPAHISLCPMYMEYIIRRRRNQFVCEGRPSGHRIVGFASPDRVLGKGRGRLWLHFGVEIEEKKDFETMEADGVSEAVDPNARDSSETPIRLLLIET